MIPEPSEGPSSAICPYCHAFLLKRPERKSKCKSCGKSIFVKSLPTTRERVLVTEDQARAIDAEWTAHYQSRAIEHWLNRYDLRVDVFRERRAARHDIRDRDIIWGMFNEQLQELMRQGDFQGLKIRYYQMALFVAEEDRDFVDLLSASHQMELRRYAQFGVVNRVRISSAGAGNACAACLRLDGQMFTIEEALRTMSLPCKSCTSVVVGSRPGFCRCQYLAVVD
jgi:hypothetical protein